VIKSFKWALSSLTVCGYLHKYFLYIGNCISCSSWQIRINKGTVPTLPPFCKCPIVFWWCEIAFLEKDHLGISSSSKAPVPGDIKFHIEIRQPRQLAPWQEVYASALGKSINAFLGYPRPLRKDTKIDYAGFRIESSSLGPLAHSFIYWKRFSSQAFSSAAVRWSMGITGFPPYPYWKVHWNYPEVPWNKIFLGKCYQIFCQLCTDTTKLSLTGQGLHGQQNLFFSHYFAFPCVTSNSLWE